MKSVHLLALFGFAIPCLAQQSSASLDTKTIFEYTKASTVIILAGEGAGRLHGIGSGIIISADGVILTALHVVKGAAEVQVRLANGEVFDRVELEGIDERRDIAALKIPAAKLPALSTSAAADISVGDNLYAVSNPNGLAWSASEGILSSVRPADEIPGAGSGFRLLQFTAPIAPGSSGGALVNRAGNLVGIITSSKGNMGFAVPIESVSGLAEGGHPIPFGTGASLQLPEKTEASVPKSSAAVANADPKRILAEAKTIHIESKTSFLTVDTLDHALADQKDWPKLGLVNVQDPRVADLLVTIDRPLFTYVHTFVITDKRTSVILASGKQTAFDGTIASAGLAKQIVAIFRAARNSAPPKP